MRSSLARAHVESARQHATFGVNTISPARSEILTELCCAADPTFPWLLRRLQSSTRRSARRNSSARRR